MYRKHIKGCEVVQCMCRSEWEGMEGVVRFGMGREGKGKGKDKNKWRKELLEIEIRYK